MFDFDLYIPLFSTKAQEKPHDNFYNKIRFQRQVEGTKASSSTLMR